MTRDSSQEKRNQVVGTASGGIPLKRVPAHFRLHMNLRGEFETALISQLHSSSLGRHSWRSGMLYHGRYGGASLAPLGGDVSL